MLQRSLLILVVIFSLFGWVAYFSGGIILSWYFYLFVPVLAFYYCLYRLKLGGKISFNVLIALFFFYISDLLQSKNLFGNNHQLQFFQMLAVFVSQFFYLLEFRKEGAFLITNRRQDPYKLIISGLIVFFLSGFVFLDVSNIYFFLLMFFTAFELYILIIFSLFRPVKKYSYYIGIFGVCLMFLAEVLFTFDYFIQKTIQIYVSSMILYFVSQVFIIESFVHSSKETE